MQDPGLPAGTSGHRAGLLSQTCAAGQRGPGAPAHGPAETQPARHLGVPFSAPQRPRRALRSPPPQEAHVHRQPLPTSSLRCRAGSGPSRHANTAHHALAPGLLRLSLRSVLTGPHPVPVTHTTQRKNDFRWCSNDGGSDEAA